MHNKERSTIKSKEEQKGIHKEAPHRELHNTESCTRQGVAHYRELHNTDREWHNTGKCTTQGDAQGHPNLDSGWFWGLKPSLWWLNVLHGKVHNVHISHLFQVDFVFSWEVGLWEQNNCGSRVLREGGSLVNLARVGWV